TKSWNWLTFVLPYVEQENLFKALDPLNSTHADRAALIATAIPTFLCPADTERPEWSGGGWGVRYIDWTAAPNRYHHACTTYDRLNSVPLTHGVTSYFGCWGQSVALSALPDGIQGPNSDAPAAGNVIGGPSPNPPHSDWCNAGDGLHFAINYVK